MVTENKLASKAARLDFSNLPGFSTSRADEGSTVQPPPSSLHKPKTAPGVMMALAGDARSDLIRENEDLRSQAKQTELLQLKVTELVSDLEQWNGARATRLIDPKRIKRSKWSNRHDHSFSDQEFCTLKDELASAGGNVQPIKVRQIGRDEDGDLFEIVFGHRRHQGCLELGLPVLAMVESVNDQNLFVEMDRENRARKNLSPWEQGVMYKRALDEGLFPSQRKLADAVGADLANVGKALRLAKLPPEVVDAFASPLDLQYRFAQGLDEVFQRDPTSLIQRAKDLALKKPHLPAKAVYETLTTVSSNTDSKSPNSFSVQVDGLVIGEVIQKPNGRVVIDIAPGSMETNQLSLLKTHLENFFSKRKVKP